MINKNVTIESLVDSKTISRDDANILVECLKNKVKILILGKMATGKSTVMKAIYSEIKEIYNVAILNANMEIKNKNENTGIFEIGSFGGSEILDDFIDYVDKNDSYALIDELESILSGNEKYSQKMNDMINNNSCIITLHSSNLDNLSKDYKKYFNLIIEVTKNIDVFKVNIKICDESFIE